MERTACVDIRALPLQLLLRAHPDWNARPVAVVDRDKPQGLILWANRAARAQRIHPGMRYAVGLSLSRELCAGVVADLEIHDAVAEITRRLWSFSPRIEPSPREAGVFWLDVSGMRFLYPSLEEWAGALAKDLRDTGFSTVIAVGFSRFGSYAVARASTKNIVLHSPTEEQAQVRKVPVACLNFPPTAIETLSKLGIDTLGRFLDLPVAGIVRRFGAEAGELHRLARGKGWAPLDAQRLLEPIESSLELEYPEDNLERLLTGVMELLQSLLCELATRHERLAVFECWLTLDNHQELHEEITPATPTLEANQVLALCRLRLGTLSLRAGVVELKVRATGIATSEHQTQLFPSVSAHNLEAAEQALAKVRAELGSNAVVHACLHEGHLPEARYGWEVLQHLTPPHPSPPSLRPLVRRLYTPAIALPPRDHHEPDGWLVAGISEGPVEEVLGPHLVSGGWWLGETTRTYYYARTRSGRWLWIYHDRRRRRWFLHGEVQ